MIPGICQNSRCILERNRKRNWEFVKCNQLFPPTWSKTKTSGASKIRRLFSRRLWKKANSFAEHRVCNLLYAVISKTIIATGLVVDVAPAVYLSLHSIEVIYFATTNTYKIKQLPRLGRLFRKKLHFRARFHGARQWLLADGRCVNANVIIPSISIVDQFKYQIWKQQWHKILLFLRAQMKCS